MANMKLPAAAKEHRACCEAQSLAESGCTVYLPRRSTSSLCLSGTRYQAVHRQKGRLCDHIFWWINNKTLLAMAIELKGGQAQVGHLVDQLQGGADLIASLSCDAKVTFLPVLVHKQINTIQIRVLRKARITFRSQRHKIELIRCGAKIEDVLV